MDAVRVETKAVENTPCESVGKDIQELGELQLALVGGGIGDPVWG